MGKLKNVAPFVAGVLIAVLWGGITIIFTIIRAGAEDTMPLDLPVPLWVRIGCNVVWFPTVCLTDWRHFPGEGVPYSTTEACCVAAWSFNSMLWGFAFVYACQLLARIKRRSGARKAAVIPEA